MHMPDSIDGIYSAYITGAGGQGFAMLVFRKGKITGADAVGAQYDGTYASEGQTSIAAKLSVSLPPNIYLVQGGTIGPEGDKHELSFHISADFLKKDFIRVEGKHGPVNVKLVKLSDLHD